MKQNRTNSYDKDMLKEYDFSKGIRGKYVNRFKEGGEVIILDPDVAEIFSDSASVNNALRSIAHIVRNQVKKQDVAYKNGF
ncbi:MAG: hypothetical protein JRJ49_10615 [Deltaproteobacteria bacterium]|nr:hypothetical protein [Deltaproteobacteria bacterium]